MKPGENSLATGASFTLHGAGVAGGIAIGHAHLVSTARLEVAHYEIAPRGVEAEIERFDRAIAQVRGELAALQTSVSAGAPAEMKAIDLVEGKHVGSTVVTELIGTWRPKVAVVAGQTPGREEYGDTTDLQWPI